MPVPAKPARRRRGSLALASALAALAALAFPAAATAYERSFDPVPGVVTPPPPGKTVGDAVNFDLSPSFRSAGRRAPGPENAYRTRDGKTVYVALDGYAPDPAADQQLVDFLGALLHGRELNGLRVLVVTPNLMPQYCGGQAAACYDPVPERIFVVGEDSFGGLPTDYVLAHEYGHHVARNRRNPPFPGSAYFWGGKRWATYVGACPGVASGKYSANYRTGYYRFPGEGWAESFAYYHFRDGNHPSGHIRWEWHPGLKPDARAYQRIRADVLRPWRHPDVVRRSGFVSENGDRVDSFSVPTPLDGGLIVKMTGPRRADLDLFLFSNTDGLAVSSTTLSSRENVRYLVCGSSRARLVVRAIDGAGRFKLLARVP